MIELENLRRLRWKCRRGMLELDVLLERFLDKGYSDLSDEERQQFELLLEESDTQLQEWLFQQKTPQNAAFIRLVEKIR